MNSPHVKKLGLLEGPLLVFGGPYSNLAATRAVRADAEQLSIPPERIICTGDLAAYCAEPEETVSLIREWGVHVVLGNCEESLASRSVGCGCGFEEGSTCSVLSDQWFRFADGKISESNRLWMGTLPFTLNFQLGSRRFSCVHGGVDLINRFFFASTPEEEKLAELNFLGQDVDGLITGHSGIPFGQMIEGRAWLNAGVVGLPANDGTADGWYMVLDHVDNTIKAEWRRLSYPADQTRQLMLDAGLVSGYADTLLSGLWPSEDVLPAEEKMNRGKALELEPLSF
jgi:predicted phosphodiesterase